MVINRITYIVDRQHSGLNYFTVSSSPYLSQYIPTTIPTSGSRGALNYAPLTRALVRKKYSYADQQFIYAVEHIMNSWGW